MIKKYNLVLVLFLLIAGDCLASTAANVGKGSENHKSSVVKTRLDVYLKSGNLISESINSLFANNNNAEAKLIELINSLELEGTDSLKFHSLHIPDNPETQINSGVAADLAAKKKARAKLANRGENREILKHIRNHVSVECSSEEQCKTLIEELRKQDSIESVNYQHNLEFYSNITGPNGLNDPLYNGTGQFWGKPLEEQWGLKATGANSAWTDTRGEGVIVAVVDSGVDYNHPDLKENIFVDPTLVADINNDGKVNYKDLDTDNNDFLDENEIIEFSMGWSEAAFKNGFFYDFGKDFMDFEGHGTQVAGVIAAAGNNSRGIVGVAPESKIMIIQAYPSNFLDEFIAAQGIIYAVGNGADIINISWGSYFENLDDLSNNPLKQAIDYASNLGVLVVTAAGNSSADSSFAFPASSPETITVAAANPDSSIASFSNYGSSVDVLAPGVDIVSTLSRLSSQGLPNFYQDFPFDDYAYTYSSGTSLAAAHISGALALLKASHPSFTNQELKNLLKIDYLGNSLSTIQDFRNFPNKVMPSILNSVSSFQSSNILNVDLKIELFGNDYPELEKVLSSNLNQLSFKGEASGENFASYELSYLTYDDFINANVLQAPANWVQLAANSVEAQPDLFGNDFEFLSNPNLSGISGPILIRLTAFNTDGESVSDIEVINILDEANKIPVSNCEQLQNIYNDLTADYYLTNDIECAGSIDWNGGAGFTPISGMKENRADLSAYEPFMGSLDGQGYVIKDLFLNNTYFPSLSKDIGIFRSLKGASINNLKIDNVKMFLNNDFYAGILAGKALSGSTIINVEVSNSEINSTGRTSGLGLLVGKLIGSNIDVIFSKVFKSKLNINFDGEIPIGSIGLFLGSSSSNRPEILKPYNILIDGNLVKESELNLNFINSFVDNYYEPISWTEENRFSTFIGSISGSNISSNLVKDSDLIVTAEQDAFLGLYWYRMAGFSAYVRNSSLYANLVSDSDILFNLNEFFSGNLLADVAGFVFDLNNSTLDSCAFDGGEISTGDLTSNMLLNVSDFLYAQFGSFVSNSYAKAKNISSLNIVTPHIFSAYSSNQDSYRNCYSDSKWNLGSDINRVYSFFPGITQSQAPTLESCYFTNTVPIVINTGTFGLAKPEYLDDLVANTQGAYLNWDFNSIWSIDEGNDTPKLQTLEELLDDLDEEPPSYDNSFGITNNTLDVTNPSDSYYGFGYMFVGDLFVNGSTDNGFTHSIFFNHNPDSSFFTIFRDFADGEYRHRLLATEFLSDILAPNETRIFNLDFYVSGEGADFERSLQIQITKTEEGLIGIPFEIRLRSPIDGTDLFRLQENTPLENAVIANIEVVDAFNNVVDISGSNEYALIAYSGRKCKVEESQLLAVDNFDFDFKKILRPSSNPTFSCFVSLEQLDSSGSYLRSIDGQHVITQIEDEAGDHKLFENILGKVFIDIKENLFGQTYFNRSVVSITDVNNDTNLEPYEEEFFSGDSRSNRFYKNSNGTLSPDLSGNFLDRIYIDFFKNEQIIPSIVKVASIGSSSIDGDLTFKSVRQSRSSKQAPTLKHMFINNIKQLLSGSSSKINLDSASLLPVGSVSSIGNNFGSIRLSRRYETGSVNSVGSVTTSISTAYFSIDKLEYEDKGDVIDLSLIFKDSQTTYEPGNPQSIPVNLAEGRYTISFPKPELSQMLDDAHDYDIGKQGNKAPEDIVFLDTDSHEQEVLDSNFANNFKLADLGVKDPNTFDMHDLEITSVDPGLNSFYIEANSLILGSKENSNVEIFKAGDYKRQGYSEALETISIKATDKSGASVIQNLKLRINRDENVSLAKVIGETGSVEIPFAERIKTKTLYFKHHYQNPVVILNLNSNNDQEPPVAMVNNINSNSFDVEFNNWIYQNSWSQSIERVDYFVLEAGEYNLGDGTKVIADFASATKDFQTVNFSSSFASDPIVLTQVQTLASSDKPVVERVRNISETGFELQIEAEESQALTLQTNQIAYIALEESEFFDITTLQVNHSPSEVDIDPINNILIGNMQTTKGSDTAYLRSFASDDSSSMNVYIQEEKSRDQEIAHIQEDVSILNLIKYHSIILYEDETYNLALKSEPLPRTIAFNYVSNSGIFALSPLNSFAGVDLDNLDIEIFNAPDRVKLNEDGTIDFDAGSLSSSGAIDYKVTDARNQSSAPAQIEFTNLQNPSSQVEIGTLDILQSNSTSWTTVNLSKSFNDPVVIMSPLTFKGSDPSTVRVRNISSTSFEFQIDEWDYKDGWHTTETVNYMVVEKGIHPMADGSVFEAGTLEVGSSAVTQGLTYKNSNAFLKYDPLVFAQVSSVNEASAVIPRLSNVSSNSFTIRLDEEEVNDRVHAPETVSYLAIYRDPLINLSGSQTRLGNLGITVNHNISEISFGESFAVNTVPKCFAQAQTYLGGDTIAIRFTNVSSDSLSLFLEEEKSKDSEIAHIQEGVAYYCSASEVDFAEPSVATSFTSYGDRQDLAGNVEFTQEPIALDMFGNNWKAIDFPYTVGPNTVIEFEFSSSQMGELHGLGFDDDLEWSPDKFFKLYGTQDIELDIEDYSYNASGDKQVFRIPIGQFYTGDMKYLFFLNDQDIENPNSQSSFENIRVYESLASIYSGEQIDFSINLHRSYSTNQDLSGYVNLEENNTALDMFGNNWKAVNFPYTVGPNTVIEFEFSSSQIGELQGLGFDDDLELSLNRFFKLYGTQEIDSIIEDYRYNASGEKQLFRIPVGQFYTGEMKYLFFANDYDVENPNSQSLFSKIRVFESLPE